MRSTWLAPLAAITLAACTGETPTRPDEPPAEPASGPGASAAAVPDQTATTDNVSITDAAALVGEYRVAGIDGEPLDAPIGIAVSIGPRTIELAPCAGLTWRYTFVAGALETERSPRSPDEPIYRIPREIAATGTAFDTADRVHRTPANGIEFSGGGHSVLLFSQ